MVRQYGPQRHRYERLPDGSSRPVGTIPVGKVFRTVERHARTGQPVIREHIVEAWLPRRVGGWRRVAGRCARTHADVFVARAGHLAKVRCLSDGKRCTMADHLVRRWVDLDVRHEWGPIPPAIPKHRHHRFRLLRTAEGTLFDVDRAA